MTPEEIEKYQKHYDEDKFWNKVAKYAKKAGREVISYALLLFYTGTADTTPMGAKAIIWGAIGYFILPIDLIPDFIPVVGFSDDLAALVSCYRTVKQHITPEIEQKVEQKLHDWFNE